MNQSWSQDLYVKAWDFATFAHEGQTYGGPLEGRRIPYINHIGSVAMETICGVNSDPSLNGNLAIQCALLHDVVEDTDITLQTLEKEFGEDVAKGVGALTKNESLSTKAEQMRDSLDRILLQPKEVWIVKLADRITNLSEPPAYWTNEKRVKYREEAITILSVLKESNELLASRFLSRINYYSKYIKTKVNLRDRI